jgi:amino acid permease
MESSENLLHTELQVDAEVQRHLGITAKWAKFLSIIGFIFCALAILVDTFNFVNYQRQSSDYFIRETLSPMVSIIVVLIMSIIWFAVSAYTFRFATKMKTALQSTDQLSFNDSLSNLAKNYKLLGIVTIIYLALMLLGVIWLFAFASFGRY